MTDDYIKINIVGKIFEKKTFDIKMNAKIEIVKRLIIARLKLNGNTITPTLNNCYLIKNTNEKLDNNKTVSELIKNKIIENNSDLSLELSVINQNNELLSFNCLLDDKLQFGSIDCQEKLNVVNKLDQSVETVSNLVRTNRDTIKSFIPPLVKSVIPSFLLSKSTSNNTETWHDTFSWSDKPINDKDWIG